MERGEKYIYISPKAGDKCFSLIFLIFLCCARVYYSRAKTSCTIALTMLKGKSFCSMAGMVTRYSVPCTLNFGIRLRTVATMSYGNWGFAIGVVMLGRLFRGECDSVLRRGLYRMGVKCIMCTQQTTGYIFFQIILFTKCTTDFLSLFLLYNTI